MSTLHKPDILICVDTTRTANLSDLSWRRLSEPFRSPALASIGCYATHAQR